MMLTLSNANNACNFKQKIGKSPHSKQWLDGSLCDNRYPKMVLKGNFIFSKAQVKVTFIVFICIYIISLKMFI